jgi:hypothetical protein
MKKIFLAVVIFTALQTTSYAQSKKFTFKLGSEYSLPKKSDDLSFFGNSKDGIINLTLKKEELTVLRFEPNTLNQTSDKVIELPEATKNFNSETVASFANNNNFWLHSDWDKGSGSEMLYSDKIDVSGGKLTNTNTKLLETTKLAGDMSSFNFYQAKTVNKYNYNFDASQTKLLVSYRLKPEEKNDKINYDKLGFQVLDENMNKLWGAEFTMPYTEAIMDNSDFSIDYNGNAYLLAKVYDSEKRKERDKETGLPAYHYEVLKFTKGNKQIIHSTIDVGQYFTRQVSLVENSLHEMVIACTYSKNAKGDGTDGIFLATLDQNGKIKKYKNGYYEFPLEELEKYESARSKRKIERKGDYEIPYLTVRAVQVESDGSIFIACEQYHIETYTSVSSNGRTTTYYYYHYDDILGTKINADGKMNWIRKIPKNQMGSSGRGTMSYKLISDASGYYFLYLDNKKNMELDADETPKQHKDGFGGQVVVAKIDNTGNVTKELVFDTREEDVMLFPSQFSKINSNQFIGRARIKKNLFQPLLITVN